ncbi:uncharacterized protein [Aegilops tauschii subsp. strangulata]|uniref:uncharacterized protein n=1 Tax=Aegilops tauschii subsp. strangulata TaxID=200361 RepID=UPI003CC86587
MGSSRSKPVREQQPSAPPKPKQMPEPEPKPKPTPTPKKKHDPKVEVPPLIDPPPNAACTRMLVPGYELWFGKPSLRTLFDDYFNQAGSVNAGVMLKMVEDPHVNLTAAYLVGYPLSLWYPMVHGTAGNKSFPFEDLKNWDCGISYGVGSDSPLSPSLNFSLELLRSTQLVASFYEHQVVQRQVYSVIPTEATKITNYIDFGLELTTRVGKDEPTDDADNSSFQIAANWQANKNLLVKGKLGPSKSSVALAFKSWWKPSFTFSFTAANDHSKGTTAYGFGIHVDDLRDQVSETQLQ